MPKLPEDVIEDFQLDTPVYSGAIAAEALNRHPVRHFRPGALALGTAPRTEAEDMPQLPAPLTANRINPDPAEVAAWKEAVIAHNQAKKEASIG